MPFHSLQAGRLLNSIIMETIRIDILNPIAKKLLKNLADLNLIKFNRANESDDFSALIDSLRAKSKDDISPEEIASEVEQVRKARHMSWVMMGENDI